MRGAHQSRGLLLAGWLCLALWGSVPFAQAQPAVPAGAFKLSGSNLFDDFDEFGYSVEPLGDLNQDGVEDIAVGARMDDDGGTDRGAVYILFLNPDGSVGPLQKISSTQGGFTSDLQDGDLFGTSLANLGDVDGDGVTDLAVGAQHGNGYFSSTTENGVLYILFLNTDGTVKAQAKLGNNYALEMPYPGMQNGDEFGLGVAAVGDLNGDGITELVAGAWGDDENGTDTGDLWVIFLSPSGVPTHRKRLNLGAVMDTDDAFATSVAALGDLDGDGFMEIAVGASRDDDGGTNRGAVYFFELNADGSPRYMVKTSHIAGGGWLLGLDDEDRFGFDVANAGDVNGDGVTDLLVSAILDDDGGGSRGAVYTLFLNADIMGAAGPVQGVQKISDLSPHVSLDNDDRFGVGVAAIGDIDDDGVGDYAIGAYRDDDGGSNRGAVWILFMDSSPLTCGNGALDPLEECDDGNTADLDGCSTYCEVEDRITFYGNGSGAGFTSVRVDGVNMGVTPMAGDPPTAAATGMASVINTHPSLPSRLPESAWGEAVGNATVTNARLTELVNMTGGVPGTVGSITPGTVQGRDIISAENGFMGDLDAEDWFGSAIAAIGDLNGDGVTDLAVGAPGDDDFSDPNTVGDPGSLDLNFGAVWILFMHADGFVQSYQKISQAEGWVPDLLPGNYRFGSELASLGDLDGDGNGDLAVATPGHRLWILFLNADGTVKAHQEIHAVLDLGLTTSGGFVRALEALGDLDGDGVTDICATSADGLVILFMNSDGTVKDHAVNPGIGGSDFAALGDLDQDGVVDLAMGLASGAEFLEYVKILFLNSDGTIKSEAIIDHDSGGFHGLLNRVNQWPDNHTVKFGEAVTAVGDINGDGVVDLAVGTPEDIDGQAWLTTGKEYPHGSVYILFLNTDGTVKGYQKISELFGNFPDTLREYDRFGAALGNLGDFNHDAIPDLAVGVPYRDDYPGQDQGAFWILHLDGAAALCGDGVLVHPEGCDDGNLAHSDGCSAACTIEVCGDGLPGLGETCDPPGSAAGGNGQLCRMDCTVCGDGIQDAGEQCDDGNGDNLDGCTNACLLPPPAGIISDLEVSLEQGGDLRLDWAPSCSGSDNDYVVYSGDMPLFGLRLPLTCSTGGATSWIVPAAPDFTFYLVVPRNEVREGSAGYTNVGGVPIARSGSSSPCLPVQIGVCGLP